MPLPYPVGFDIADDAEAWESAGFTVRDGEFVHLSEITIRLVGRSHGQGIVGWSFANLPNTCTADVHGIPTTHATAKPANALDQATLHRNGAYAVDHIVVMSHDWQQGVRDFNDIGLKPLRLTDKVRKGVTQVIYRPSQAIIELVGPEKPPAIPQVWGFTLVTKDVDMTHHQLPDTTKKPWPAVQPGRQMTVLKHAQHGVSVGIAFMSPHVRDLEGKGEDREKLLEKRARAQEEILQKRETPGWSGPASKSTL